MAGLFFWNRSESRNDSRHMETMIKSNSEMIRCIHNEIHAEMKDFHGRLCALEERKRGES
jgi:hypothetical protein